MRIQHNIPAMSAYRNYTNNVSAMKKNLEKLSSGYKINRAGDDAAGLAISEKMRAQITGLETAQKNAKDGISLVQTAEGALTEVHDMLNRMVTLATQSANGTYDNDTDRVQLQKELDQLKEEINRISKATNFNGIDLLSGDFETKSTSAVGQLMTELGVDGSNPTAAGAAVVNFKLTNAADGAATTVNATATTDGGEISAATKGSFTLKMGGSTYTNISVAGGSVNTGSGTPTTIGAGSTLAGTGGTTTATVWGAGDSVQIKLSDTETITVNYGDGDNSLEGDITAALQDKGVVANKDATTGEITFDTEKSAVTITGVLTDSAGNDFTVTAGTTTLTALKNAYIKDGTDYYKVSDYFDVTTSGNATGAIANGDEIVFTAKVAGKVGDTTNNKLVGALKGGTVADSGVTETTLQATGTAVDGTDAGQAVPTNAPTKYVMDIDWSKVTGGATLEIGSQKFVFKTDGTASGTAISTGEYSGYTAIDISMAKNDNDKADIFEDYLTDSGNIAEDGGTNQLFELKREGDKFTLTGVKEADSGVDDANGNNIMVPDYANTNLGELRSNIDGLIKADSSSYTPAEVPTVEQPAPGPYATATYNIGALAENSKIYIGDKMVEIIASTASEVKPGQVKMSSNNTTLANDIVAAFEAQGIGIGKVSLTAPSGSSTDWTMAVTGTEVGQTGSDLASNTTVKVLAASATPDASEAKLGSNTITAGTTTITNIKAFQVDGKNLGDNFTIKVNGKIQSDSYVIAEGDEISITANNNGRLSDTAMKNLAVSGDGVATSSVSNGYDEGKTAGGDKTTYNIAFTMNKLAGGNTFTIGNESGKSYTFEISYDAAGNKDGTIGANDKEEVVGDRTVINLYGKTEEEAANAIKDAISSKMSGNFDMNSSLVGGKLNVLLTAKEEGQEYNLGNIRVSNQSGAFTDLQYNPAGGAANGVEGTYAQVTYKFDKSQLQEGDVLDVGGTKIYFGSENKAENVDGKTKITVNVEDAKKDINEIVKALESAGYRSGQVKFSDAEGTMTITGIQTGETAAELAGAGGKVSLSSNVRQLTSGGLKLQIGDTADSFNQLTVNIAPTDCKSLGIEDLDISNQEGAAKAIDIIKSAINQVSDIRGTLGATQNRLDHTINNLSVMTENIQDAESTIRDTDVASEMMEYTKNNILIQSAQAMLAQANQMPQGVLQLLQ